MEDKIKPPGEYLRAELKERGWSQTDLARILNRPIQVVNEIVLGKRAVTLETAIALAAAFDSNADVWLQRETAYRLSQSSTDASDVQDRARLYSLAPIKEMERRGWIQKADSADGLDDELCRFFGVDDLTTEINIGAVTRKSDSNDPLSVSQRAWCFQVRHVASKIIVGEFIEDRLDACKKKLRKIAAYPQEVYRISSTLASFGIRFVVVEPMPGAKVDGVAMWLDSDTPVIGMSLRYDRVDSLWHTLAHELSHIVHRDEAPLDADLTDKMASIVSVRSEMERRADDEAADMLIPSKELESFVRRVGPQYSKQRINQFANRIKIHPGIIVGQLQHRSEIGFHANREMLVKIRDLVTHSATTDGWGYLPNAGSES